MIVLDSGNCMRVTGLSYESILAVTGIFGLISDCPELRRSISLCWKDNCIEFSLVSYEFIKHYSVYIYPKGDRYINNSFLALTKQRQVRNVALRLLRSQVKYASDLKFDRIEINTAGSGKTKNFVSGYELFGGLGFFMEKAYHQKLQKKLRSDGQDLLKSIVAEDGEIFLHQVLESKKGVSFWKEFGFPWAGTFYLSSDAKYNSKEILAKKEQSVAMRAIKDKVMEILARSSTLFAVLYR
jgi:hypothetical protein